MNGCLWVISWVAPKKPCRVDWLWVPLTHLFVARNWKSAISWFARTASMVAKRVAVSTPLRIGFSVAVIVSTWLVGGGGARGRADGIVGSVCVVQRRLDDWCSAAVGAPPTRGGGDALDVDRAHRALLVWRRRFVRRRGRWCAGQ